MKTILSTLGLLTSIAAFAQTLPVITSSPTNATVYPGNAAIFTVAATGATSYQWIFQGAPIAGATNATLQLSDAQSTNCGYYLVLAGNASGLVPSQMAYLTLDYTQGGLVPTAGGILPFSNTNNTYFAGDLDANDDDGLSMFGMTMAGTTVQIIAGPQLDEMKTLGTIISYGEKTLYSFTNGYYKGPSQIDATAFPGQMIYYGIVCDFTNSGLVWPSTIMAMTAGTNGSLAPSGYGLKFPGWFPLEGVEPAFYEVYTPAVAIPATNQVLVPGETWSTTNTFFAYTDYGVPTIQWRKNGVPILNLTNEPYQGFSGSLAITNIQASDAGIYDMIVYGNEWVVSPKIALSVQTANGQGVFQKTKLVGTNLVCSLSGAAGRQYNVQWSTNLLQWYNLVTLTNVSGTINFTNPAIPALTQFFRTVLLPSY